MSSSSLTWQHKVRGGQRYYAADCWDNDITKTVTSPRWDTCDKKKTCHLPVAQLSHPSNSASWKTCNGDFQMTAQRRVDSFFNESTSCHFSLFFWR